MTAAQPTASTLLAALDDAWQTLAEHAAAAITVILTGPLHAYLDRPERIAEIDAARRHAVQSRRDYLVAAGLLHPAAR